MKSWYTITFTAMTIIIAIRTTLRLSASIAICILIRLYATVIPIIPIPIIGMVIRVFCILIESRRQKYDKPERRLSIEKT